MSQEKVSKVIQNISGRNGAITGFDAQNYKDLKRIGINVEGRYGDIPAKSFRALVGDDINYSPSILFPSVPTPVQFLQAWLPGFVAVATAPRKIDEIIGMQIVGSWEDQEVVFASKELLNNARPYGDTSNIPLSSYNVNFERRTNIRFEHGMMVNALESAQAGRLRLDAGSEKRTSCMLGLEIVRNSIGFFGYNNGTNLTDGFLNATGLPAYYNFPNGASGSSKWNDKSFIEIVADIKLMCQTLRTQSKDLIDPLTAKMTLALATDSAEALTQVSAAGTGSYTVMAWIKDNHPGMRIVTAPELDNASSNLNVAYLFADTVNDGASSDNLRTFDQFITQKFLTLGVEKTAKGYVEDYSNGSAGVACKRPYAVTRGRGC